MFGRPVAFPVRRTDENDALRKIQLVTYVEKSLLRRLRNLDFKKVAWFKYRFDNFVYYFNVNKTA